jgi:hypothetical protein
MEGGLEVRRHRVVTRRDHDVGRQACGYLARKARARERDEPARVPVRERLRHDVEHEEERVVLDAFRGDRDPRIRGDVRRDHRRHVAKERRRRDEQDDLRAREHLRGIGGGTDRRG